MVLADSRWICYRILHLRPTAKRSSLTPEAWFSPTHPVLTSGTPLLLLVIFLAVTSSLQCICKEDWR